jgi:hypothetical protein
MPVIYCACGDAVTQKAFDEATRLKADSYRCEICLAIWLESPATRMKLNGGTNMKVSKITPEKVEQCAFEGLSLETAADEIGVAQSTLKNAIFSDKTSDLNAAWKRGKERRQNQLNGEESAEKKNPGTSFCTINPDCSGSGQCHHRA